MSKEELLKKALMERNPFLKVHIYDGFKLGAKMIKVRWDVPNGKPIHYMRIVDLIDFNNDEIIDYIANDCFSKIDECFEREKRRQIRAIQEGRDIER